MKGWRTIAVFALSAILYILAWQPLTQVVDGQIIAVATAVAGVALRFITSTAVGQKE